MRTPTATIMCTCPPGWPSVPETASENPNGFVGKCGSPTGPVPTDRDRAKVKEALGELGEVTGAVEAMARLLASEKERAYDKGVDDGWSEGNDR